MCGEDDAGLEPAFFLGVAGTSGESDVELFFGSRRVLTDVEFVWFGQRFIPTADGKRCVEVSCSQVRLVLPELQCVVDYNARCCVELADAGFLHREIADLVGVSRSAVSHALKRRLNRGVR